MQEKVWTLQSKKLTAPAAIEEALVPPVTSQLSKSIPLMAVMLKIMLLDSDEILLSNKNTAKLAAFAVIPVASLASIAQFKRYSVEAFALEMLKAAAPFVLILIPESATIPLYDAVTVPLSYRNQKHKYLRLRLV